MKKVLAVLLLLSLCTASLTAQEKRSHNLTLHQLYGVHYLNRIREYEGNTGYDDFSDSINYWGAGGTVFAGFGPLGAYTQTAFFIPTGHSYDPESPLGKQQYTSFRIGMDSLSGLGLAVEITPELGFLLGAGIHWDLSFMYKDPYYGREGSEPSLTFDLGLGSGADIYVMASDTVSLYFGAMVAWDFLVLQGNSFLNQNWEKGTHWIYGFNGGLGFKLK
ncbi:MAG: hypothetical protein PQJ58_03675 [Spirochaetales bacterium]|nr:hypothetical protein [Spirochaetales bacterium]